MNRQIELSALPSATSAAASSKKNKLRPRRSMHALESRIVFDGALAASLVDPNHPVDVSAKAIAVDASRAIIPAAPVPPKQVVFVESNVTNYQSLLQGFNSSAEVHVLDANQDGLTQMAQILAGRSGIAAIQIVSHGSEATVQLGALNLNAQTLNTRAADIAAISNALGPNADILLYGCDVAKGSDGAAFVQALARDTHAVVAASTDLTGAAGKGGNWTLEYATGVLHIGTLHDYSYQNTLVTTATYGFDTGLSTTGSTTITSAPTTGTAAAGETIKLVANNGVTSAGTGLWSMNQLYGVTISGTDSISTSISTPGTTTIAVSLTSSLSDLSH